MKCLFYKILIEASPVFAAMLKKHHFKEGKERRIELPGKKLKDIEHMLDWISYNWPNSNTNDDQGKTHI